MHAETLREREAGKTTVCRMFSCQRRPAACAGCVSFFDIAWVRLDQDRAESRIPSPSLPVVIGAGSHPFPFRTRKLSLLPPMVLHGKLCGRVGRCRHYFPRPEMSIIISGLFLCGRCLT